MKQWEHRGVKVELAVCVLMVDTPAIKRVGDALMQVIEKLPTCPSELPPVDEDIGLKEFFELVDNVAQGWLGFGMRFGNTTVCAMMFRGEPCVEIGVICAQQRVLGIVTFLDEQAREELERKMQG